MSVFAFRGGILVLGWDRRFCAGATGKRAADWPKEAGAHRRI